MSDPPGTSLESTANNVNNIDSSIRMTSSRSGRTNNKKDKRPVNPPCNTDQPPTLTQQDALSTKGKSQRKRKPKAKQVATSTITDESQAITDSADITTNKNKQQHRNKVKDKNNSSDKPRFNKQRVQGQLTIDDTAVLSVSDNAEETSTTGQVKKKNSNKDNNSGRSRNRSSNKKKSLQSLPSPPDTNDMATTMAYELSTSTYECMVCWDVVRPANHTWTCDNCWAIFHINCIEKWATKSLKDTSTNMMITSWRCPGCQHKRTAIPQGYFCFCGKQQNPNPKHYQTPHTCGDLCKRLRKCPHPCVLPCHPGPCPPCTSMGPINVCFCGKDRRQAKCVDTNYDTNAYSCGSICNQRLGCGKHKCQEKCHAGLCPPCLIEEKQQPCYCGQSERTARCGSGVPASSIGGRTGYYPCEKICTNTYDCGVHECGKECHPCSERKTCPYDPKVITTCPCGSSTIETLLDGSSRTCCTDPIPTCGGICHKLLPCGHTCQQKCHRGACGSCEEHVKVACRCQSSEYDAVCGTVSNNSRPVCDKVCKSNRNCGRHACGNICCPATKSKGKKRAQGSEKAHDCPLECCRVLSCGKHTCKEKCHKGPCRPCLEATFDDVTCHCGRTRLEAPVRCGTQLPHCPHPCLRPSPCGHIRLLHHNCHPDDEPCPPCPVLISRECMCGKADLKNIPCYREAAHCGLVCDKVLPCGEHRCRRTCHDGNCLEDGQECTQPCQFTRTSCGHPCLIPCHGDSPCPEIVPCLTRIRATCACGQNSMEIPCNSSAVSSGSNPALECNDFCAKILRNRKLASALDIQRDDYSGNIASNYVSDATISTSSCLPLSADDLGYYDESIRSFYVENANWCKQMEKCLIQFARDDSQTSFHFKPMRPAFRRFLHRYSVHFNIATEAMDAEPYRSVAVRKTLGQCRVPPILLSQAIRDPRLMAPPNSVISTSTTQNDMASSSSSPSVMSVRQRPSKPPVNALKFSGLSFGILQEDLDALLKPVLNSSITYTTTWGREATDVVVVPNLDQITDMEEKESLIWRWRKGIRSAFLFNDIAGVVECCWINRSGEITWSELEANGKGGTFSSLTDIKGKQASQKAQHNRFDLLVDAHADEGDHGDDVNNQNLDQSKENHQRLVVDEQDIESAESSDDAAKKDEEWVDVAEL